jgi:hypothetical protein
LSFPEGCKEGKRREREREQRKAGAPVSSWNPLFLDLLTSSVLAEGPVVVSTWTLLIASADRYGESDLTPPAVASLLRITDEEADRAFDVLSSPDKRSRSRAHEGRRIIRTEEGRWLLTTHAAKRRLASTQAAADRQRRHRERLQREAEAASCCEEPGCTKEVAGAVEGRRLCSLHAFDRQPGEEG